MTSLALLLVTGTALSAGAGVCPADAVAPEPGLTTEAALSAHVAHLWGLPPRDVHFEWGPGEGEIPGEAVCLRLLGSGAGGHWVVEVTDGEGTFRRRARFGHTEYRWVAARDLPRDHTLGTDDMLTEREPRWGAPRSSEAPEPGWTTRRVIRAGQPLTAPGVAPALLVESGSAVEVEVRRGAVLLRVTGESRTAGSLGDDVQVRLPTGKLVWGTVRPGPVVEILPQQER
ncbi:MAG: flagella basal body P-ring formation protein FlgA [Gemmatimonadales bacterium]|nr:MAG: flagella basal body P-ring formation protein FlgA [Gemmatimonadales bacterium]